MYIWIFLKWSNISWMVHRIECSEEDRAGTLHRLERHLIDRNEREREERLSIAFIDSWPDWKIASFFIWSQHAPWKCLGVMISLFIIVAVSCITLVFSLSHWLCFYRLITQWYRSIDWPNPCQCLRSNRYRKEKGRPYINDNFSDYQIGLRSKRDVLVGYVVTGELHRSSMKSCHRQ